MVTKPSTFGLADASQAVRVAFLMVAGWWVLFTVPCLLWVREQKPARPIAPLAAARAGWRELRATVAEVRRYRPLVWFLLAYWLYIDGVNTIIKMAVDFGLSLGFPQQSLIAALLMGARNVVPALRFVQALPHLGQDARVLSELGLDGAEGRQRRR